MIRNFTGFGLPFFKTNTMAKTQFEIPKEVNEQLESYQSEYKKLRGVYISKPDIIILSLLKWQELIKEDIEKMKTKNQQIQRFKA